jgi:hypothetical protein
MTARARPSRRCGAPELGVAAAFDAAALLTSRGKCPVCGGVADKHLQTLDEFSPIDDSAVGVLLGLPPQ